MPFDCRCHGAQRGAAGCGAQRTRHMHGRVAGKGSQRRWTKRATQPAAFTIQRCSVPHPLRLRTIPMAFAPESWWVAVAVSFLAAWKVAELMKALACHVAHRRRRRPIPSPPPQPQPLPPVVPAKKPPPMLPPPIHQQVMKEAAHHEANRPIQAKNMFVPGQNAFVPGQNVFSAATLVPSVPHLIEEAPADARMGLIAASKAGIEFAKQGTIAAGIAKGTLLATEPRLLLEASSLEPGSASSVLAVSSSSRANAGEPSLVSSNQAAVALSASGRVAAAHDSDSVFDGSDGSEEYDRLLS